MKRTRASLFYLVGYLLFGGLGLLIVPRTTLRILLSTGDYGNVMPRLAGMLMLALGIIVAQAVRSRLDILYRTMLIVWSGTLPVLYSFYLLSGDPLFLVLLAVVGIGVIFTTVSYALDRREGT
jgi:hypothetical protein